MSNSCPAFETLSRFHDGMVEGAEEGEILGHLAGCAACRASLESMDAADVLLTASVAPRRQAGRFRLLRPALLPLAAAAVIFALTLGYIVTSPSGASDSPIAVAGMIPASETVPAEPVANVFLRERFETPQLHPTWKSADGSAVTSLVVESDGRKAVQLVSHPAGKKRWALLSSASEFPLGQGVSVDVDY